MTKYTYNAMNRVATAETEKFFWMWLDEGVVREKQIGTSVYQMRRSDGSVVTAEEKVEILAFRAQIEAENSRRKIPQTTVVIEASNALCPHCHTYCQGDCQANKE